ncbi:class A beta-lactamase-related serine hydrolase [Klenkia terrae]|uniref:Class A beta-lactamase-related serine hydrolase n=1 Tax=Klenkia terrae TaxID=1052259 RepID=A0ABU8ECP5_9ACTN|nr:class A beta-lactamase-related serine hydrolase [Klenkia terrae]SSC25853.1 Beta-lactamase/transpeptidase-like protein [Klenkia terrae]
MSRWGGRTVAVTAVLVAGLLVEAEAAQAAPVAVVRSVQPTALVAPFPAVSPIGAALVGFGPVGTLVAAVAPVQSPEPPGTTADAVARGSAGSWAVGDVDRPVPTASLVKLYLAEGILATARTAGTALPAEDLARIDAALTSSDDLAASELWVAYDGPAVLADVVARYDLQGTSAPTPDPGAWGQTLTTAADPARFLTELPDRAHPDDAELLLGALSRATPAGADGFDQSFGLLGPGRSAGTAAKQGWMVLDGQRYLHSIGVVDDRVVVVLATFPVDVVDWPAARAAVDAAAAALSR